METNHSNLIGRISRAIYGTALLLLIAFANKLPAQTPDFIREFELSPKITHGVTQQIDANHSLTAMRMMGGSPGVVLSLHDQDGKQIWTYNYKATQSIWKIEPAAIVPASYNGFKRAVIAGTVFFHAPPQENYWTSDYWLMEIDLSTGTPTFSTHFGSSKKDLCQGIVRGKDDYHWVPPNSFIPFPTYILYGRAWDYDHNATHRGVQDMLVAMTDHAGQVLDAMEYGQTSNNPNMVINFSPDDAVTNPYQVTLAGSRTMLTQWSNNASLGREPFTMHIDIGQLSNVSIFTHNPGYTMPPSQGVHIDHAGSTFNFWKEHVLTFPTDDNNTAVAHLYARSVDWARKYTSDFDHLEQADVRTLQGQIAVLCGERDASNFYSTDVGLLLLEEDGNPVQYNRYQLNGYDQPKRLEHWNGGYLAQTEPKDGGNFGGFALCGMDDQGAMSNGCYEETGANMDDLTVTTQQEAFHQQSVTPNQGDLPMTRGYEWGVAFACPEGWEHSFYGPEQHYGNFPTKQAHSAAALEITDVDFYPNPLPVGAKTLYVQVEASVETELSLEVHDLTGKRLSEMKFELQAGKNQLKIPVEVLSSGLSIATLKGPDGVIARQKIMK